jgi:hypothetical protein
MKTTPCHGRYSKVGTARKVRSDPPRGDRLLDRAVFE